MARYEKQTWVNKPDSTTPLSAGRLNKLETQFDRAMETVEAEIGTPGTAVGDKLSATIDGQVAPQLASVQSTSRLRSPIPPMMTNVRQMVQAHAPGHGFTVVGTTASTNLDDTSDVLLGTQAARLTTAGTGATASFRKTGMSLDFTGMDVRLWFKYESFAALQSLRLYLGDDTFTNTYNRIFFNASEFAGVARPGEWCVLDIPFSSLTVAGSPNRANITGFSLLVTEKSGQQATVRLGGFALIPQNELGRFPNGVVSFTFDDSFAAQYTKARPYLDRYGYRGTLFPIVGRIGQAGYLTAAQVRLMYEQGWEISAHAMTDASHNAGMIAPTNDERRTELEEIRQWQADNGYISDSYAYPLGYWNAAVAREVSRYYGSARLASTIHPATARPENSYRVVAVNAGTQQASLNALVNETIAAKGHLCVVLHDIKDTDATGNDISTANFEAFVDYVAGSGVAVRTYGEVIAAAVP